MALNARHSNLDFSLLQFIHVNYTQYSHCYQYKYEVHTTLITQGLSSSVGLLLFRECANYTDFAVIWYNLARS